MSQHMYIEEMEYDKPADAENSFVGRDISKRMMIPGVIMWIKELVMATGDSQIAEMKVILQCDLRKQSTINL